MKLSLFTSAALLFAVASAQTQQQEFKVDEGIAQTKPDFEKEDGVLPILGPATPTACKIVTVVLTGLCAFANYDGCEASVNYVQCICSAHSVRSEILKCAHSSLSGLLEGYCQVPYFGTP
ncbi:hypothetical protein BGZ81_000782 [Podila clonocystis]|nr:hypothetical protein BGZ81_000782 [Podila clonocystis]